MECNTKKGLLFLLIGSIISIFSNLAFIFLETTNSLLSVLGVIGGLISLVGIIFFLLGRKEFGERHQKFVNYAIIIYFIAFLIPAIIIAVSTFNMVSQVLSTGGISELNFSYIFYIIPFAAVLGGIAYIFALYELEDKLGRYILYSAIIISAVVAILLSIQLEIAFDETFGSVDLETLSTQEITNLQTEFSQKINVSGLYGIANGLLYLFALYIPYRRIDSGELVPVTSPSSSIPERVCPNCNKEIPVDAKSCPYCSKQFEVY